MLPWFCNSVIEKRECSVSGLSADLVSVSIITGQGFVVVLKTNDCYIIKDGEAVLVGKKLRSLNMKLQLFVMNET